MMDHPPPPAGEGRRLLAAVVALVALAAHPARAEPPSYTPDQAQAGAAAYAQHCASCHGLALSDGQFGPPLVGALFEDLWYGRPVGELHRYIRATMPPTAIGGLDEATYAAVLAFLLQQNGVAAGAAPLPTAPEALAALTMPGEIRSGQDPLRDFARSWMSPGAETPDWPAAPDPLESFTPVTDALLADPPEGEWLRWRGRDAQGFSPLTEIDRADVGDLRLAWSLALPPGPNTAEPLVHDGVLYAYAYGDHVFALDATTGQELWHYGRALPSSQPLRSKRNMALWGDKLFLATSDGHVVGLDARTGRVVWDRPIVDGGGPSGGPLAADGVVMQGVSGTGRPGGGYIVGLDAQTGEELWRFHTVAQPGDPGGDSWNGLPVEARSGGSIWTSGTYDAEHDLAFFGPGPTYDTGPLRDPVDLPGVTNDALYTDATLALRPRTGELVWYYQHMKNDQWDMDWAFERVLADVEIGGAERRVVVTSGKEGLFDVLDAATGDYVSSFDMGLQNLITAVDPETGEKSIDPELIPGGGQTEPITVCPHGGGGRNWPSTSYNPDTHVLYVPAVDLCMDMIPMESDRPGFALSSGVVMALRPREGSDGRYGVLQAIDVTTGEILWDDRSRAPRTTAALATAGGVVFAGAFDRSFSAYDDATGEELWRTKLNDVPNTFPISYSVDAKQYVAVTTGFGAPVITSFPGLTPEVAMPRANSSSIFVYALP